MDKSIYDLVVDELVSRQKDVRVELSNRFRRTKPFRMEKVSNKERLEEYSRLTPQDVQAMIQEQGPEQVDAYIKEMEELRRKQYA